MVNKDNIKANIINPTHIKNSTLDVILRTPVFSSINPTTEANSFSWTFSLVSFSFETLDWVALDMFNC